MDIKITSKVTKALFSYFIVYSSLANASAIKGMDVPASVEEGKLFYNKICADSSTLTHPDIRYCSDTLGLTNKMSPDTPPLFLPNRL